MVAGSRLEAFTVLLGSGRACHCGASKPEWLAAQMIGDLDKGGPSDVKGGCAENGSFPKRTPVLRIQWCINLAGGLKLCGSGRPDIAAHGLDRNRDGVPDSLQASAAL